MAQKLMAILGSPRVNGNSAKTLNYAIEAAEQNGAAVKQVRLGTLGPVGHCMGCNHCIKTGNNQCVLGDGLGGLVAEARNYDAILIVCPVYFAGFNSLTKAFIDRAFYSSIRGEGEPNLFAGKKFGLIITFGDDDVLISGAVNIINNFKDIAGYVGFTIEGIVYGRTTEENGPTDDLIEKCKELGERLAG
jgi:multimeric flavodoxin WrbA